MKSEFEKIFDKLVSSIVDKDKNRIQQVIEEVILYFNKIMNKNYKIKHVSMKSVNEIGDSAFMYALDDSLNYSVDHILNIQRKIIETKKDFNNDYNDVTFSMYLINTIAHELCHCNQYLDNKNGVLNEQTYLNSLCMSINYFGKIEYLDKSYEGEAYGNGVAIMRELCSENNIKNKKYRQEYKKQLLGFNFFTKNIMYHEAVYYINKIPFLITKRGFNDIFIYGSNYIATNIDNKTRAAVIKRYPLASIGIEEIDGKGRLKTPDELMEQYFNRYIKYNGKIIAISQIEKRVLEDIYIYLLLPLLTIEIYNNLCIKYGSDQMDNFMMNLSNKINEKIVLYNNYYENSKVRISKIRKVDNKILQNIDEKYAKNKYNASITYLKYYKKIIENLLSKNNKKKI